MELICNRWIVRAKDYNHMAQTALWWEDTDPAPLSAWWIAREMIPSQRWCHLPPASASQGSLLYLLPTEIRPWWFLDAEYKPSSKFSSKPSPSSVLFTAEWGNCLGPSSYNRGPPALPTSALRVPANTEVINKVFWQKRLNRGAVMRLSRNESCWDFRLMDSVWSVPAFIRSRLKQCAPSRLTPVGTSNNVMSSSTFPADARGRLLQVQGLPVCRFRGFGSPQQPGLKSPRLWTLEWSLHCFLPISSFLRMSDPAQPSTRFSKDLCLPQGLDFGDHLPKLNS